MCEPTPPALTETARRAGWSEDQITAFSKELSEATKRAYEGWTDDQIKALYEAQPPARDVIVQSRRQYGLSRIATGMTAQWPGLAEAAVEGAHQP